MCVCVRLYLFPQTWFGYHCLFCLCVCFHEWMRGAGFHRAKKTHQRRLIAIPPPLTPSHPATCLCCMRWACTLAVAPAAAAAEARLHFKAALSFGLFSLLSFSFRWCQQSGFTELHVSHTPHLQNHKKGTGTNENHRRKTRWGQLQRCLFPPPPISVSGKTHFQSFFSQFSSPYQDFRAGAEVDVFTNYMWL